MKPARRPPCLTHGRGGAYARHGCPDPAARPALGDGPGHRGSDRRRDLPDAGEHGALAWVPLLAARRVARHGRDGALRGAVLRRAGGALPRSRRRLRVPASGLRTGRRVSLRVEVPAGNGSGHHGRARRGVCPLRGVHRSHPRQRAQSSRGRGDPRPCGGKLSRASGWGLA